MHFSSGYIIVAAFFILCALTRNETTAHEDLEKGTGIVEDKERVQITAISAAKSNGQESKRLKRSIGNKQTETNRAQKSPKSHRRNPISSPSSYDYNTQATDGVLYKEIYENEPNELKINAPNDNILHAMKQFYDYDFENTDDIVRQPIHIYKNVTGYELDQLTTMDKLGDAVARGITVHSDEVNLRNKNKCGKSATNSCKEACKRAHRNSVCKYAGCKPKMRRFFRRNCRQQCTTRFA